MVTWDANSFRVWCSSWSWFDVLCTIPVLGSRQECDGEVKPWRSGGRASRGVMAGDENRDESTHAPVGPNSDTISRG